MLDVNALMKDLARKRPVFHSEADFQHALAWHIHEVGLDPRVRLEWPVKLLDSEKRIYVDLYLPNCKVGVELKYVTRELNFKDKGGECFALRSQSAQDTRRYDFLKDIERLEQLSLSERSDVRAGFAILLTNDHLYWREPPPDRKPTNDAEFRLHCSRTIKETMKWSKETGPGTKRGREDPIFLKGSYDLEWREYAQVGDGANQRFRYLAVQIG